MISVLGIIIGTAALVIVMSLFNGFRSVAHNLMIGFGPHAELVPVSGTTLRHASALANRLEHLLRTECGTGAVMPVAESKLVLVSGNRTSVATGIGIENDRHDVLQGVRSSVVVGSFETHGSEVPGIVVSIGIAERLNIRPGDYVDVFSPQMIEQALHTLTRPSAKRCIVTGIFQSSIARDADQGRVYLPYRVVHSITRATEPSALHAVVANPNVLIQKHTLLQSALNSYGKQALQLRTWEDANRGLVDTMQLERLGSFIVIALIVLVASFNVLVSLTLGVIKKQRDIAVLLTIGFTSADVKRLYMIQGMLLGGVSVALGLLIGLGVCWGQITFQWVQFNMAEGFLVPALPVEVALTDVIAVAVVGFVLAAVAALYPAHRAAQTRIADAVRVE